MKLDLGALTRRAVGWLLLIINVSGIVFVFTHDATLLVRILVPVTALIALPSALDYSYTLARIPDRGLVPIEPKLLIDIFFLPTLILTVFSVSLYLWT